MGLVRQAMQRTTRYRSNGNFINQRLGRDNVVIASSVTAAAIDENGGVEQVVYGITASATMVGLQRAMV